MTEFIDDRKKENTKRWMSNPHRLYKKGFQALMRSKKEYY